MMDSTSLYYFFSTIAQTLAGAIALLAAFSLYRLQDVVTTIGETWRIATKQIALPEDQNRMIFNLTNSGKFEEAYNYLTEHFVNMNSELDPQAKAFLGRIDEWSFGVCKNKIELRKQLIRRLKQALLITAFIIFFSVGVLPFVNFLNYCGNVVWLLVGIYLLALGCSLFIYFRLVMECLK